MFAPLFAKAYRVWRIFDTRWLAKRTMTDKDVFFVVGIFLCVDLVILLVWGLVPDLAAVPKLEEERIPNFDRAFPVYRCSTENNKALETVMLFYKVLLVLIGIIMAFLTRKIHNAFAEGKWILLAMYNIVICGVIVLVFTRIPEVSLNPFVKSVVSSIAVVEGVVVCQCLIYFPKIKKILDYPLEDDDDVERARRSVIGGDGADWGGGGGGGGGSSSARSSDAGSDAGGVQMAVIAADHELTRLKNEIEKKNRELRRIKAEVLQRRPVVRRTTSGASAASGGGGGGGGGSGGGGGQRPSTASSGGRSSNASWTNLPTHAPLEEVEEDDPAGAGERLTTTASEVVVGVAKE